MATATQSRTARTAKPRKAAATAKRASTARGASASSTSTGTYAERAILIPVGAALIARDRVVAGVGDTLTAYSSPSKAQAQLRKFERRGNTARKRLEREVRKTRTSLERELRRRRQHSSDLVDRVQERIQSLV